MAPKILRKVIEVNVKGLSMLGTNVIGQGLFCVLQQINAKRSLGGFSPSQWLLIRKGLPRNVVLDRATPAERDASSTLRFGGPWPVATVSSTDAGV